MYQHFDYFDSDTIRPDRQKFIFPCSVPYKLGTPASVGCGLVFRTSPVRGGMLDGYLHLNAVALAGVLTDFYRDNRRNYNWGSGFSFKAGLNLTLGRDKMFFRVADQMYRLYTWQGYEGGSGWSTGPEGYPADVQGDASRSLVNHLEFSVDYKIWKRLYVSAGLDFYYRHTSYDRMRLTIDHNVTYSPEISSRQLGCHLMLMYNI